MDRLKGKTAVITGGNSGIGRATAEAMARQGARVLIFGRNPETLAETQAAIGPLCSTAIGDVGKLEDLDRLAETVAKEFDGLDIVFANAGHGRTARGLGVEVTEEVWERGLEANLKGKFFTVTKLVPHLRAGGSVILTGGITNHVYIPQTAVLGLAQAGARSLARSLAVELAPRGIRVNTICPGYIFGPAYEGLDMAALQTNVVSRIPLRRMGEGREVASTAVFLASDEAAYITGAEIVVDGGLTLVM